jgi:hypothetical protein
MFTTPEHIEEAFEKAKNDPSSDYHLKSEINQVYKWIDKAEDYGEDPHEQIEKGLEQIDIGFSGLSAIEALCQWETTGSYHDARAGIHLLSYAYKISRERRWNNTAVYLLQKLITVQKELRRDCSDEIDHTVAFLEDVFKNPDDVHLTNLGTLLQILVDNPEYASQENIMRAFAVTLLRINKLHSSGDHPQERSFIEIAISLGEMGDFRTDDLEQRYVKTYRLFAEQQDSETAKGGILQRGIMDDTVTRVLSDEEKREWKSDMSDVFQAATNNLNRGGEDIGDIIDFDYEGEIERYSKLFRLMGRCYSPPKALYWFLTSNEYVPSWDENDETGYRDVFNTISPSPSGHAIQLSPNVDADSELNSRYLSFRSTNTILLVNNFNALLSRRQIQERDIYGLMDIIPWLNPSDLWYLTKVVSATFDHRSVEATHMGVARLESLLYRAMEYQEEDIDRLLESGSGTRTLGSLLDVAEKYLGEDFYQYMKYTYVEPEGQISGGNIRNRVAHGQLTRSDGHEFYASLILLDILRVIVRCDPTFFGSVFGYPSKYSLLL